MPITLTNARLLQLDPPEVSRGAIRIVADAVEDVGPAVAPAPGDETHDCGGALVLPGLVNGHTHLYSALAPGMPMPGRSPRSFHEILERIWWRLDRAHDAASVEASGCIGAIDALRCGTTTLIDHHASPNAIAGSLDRLERGIAAVGLRAVLCYEVTDRNGPAGAEAGLAENRSYLDKCGNRSDHRFAGLVGAHAAFTLSDASLRACVDLAAERKTGVHIHVAEDPCDDAICRERYGAPLLQRLERCGLLADGQGTAARSILAHGTHLSRDDAHRVSARVAAVAHNPRSNMNNGVGYAPVAHMTNALLGTDGIGGDMFTEARCAWFKSCDARLLEKKQPGPDTPAITPQRVVGMLSRAAQVAGDLLGCTLGKLTPGARADLVVTDYDPATPLTANNAAAHLLFALGPQHVRHVLIAGEWALKDRRILRVDERTVREDAARIAQSLWQRMQAIDP
ncbi:MAG: amidohydrolase family protein [Phycisphaerae bacterium]